MVTFVPSQTGLIGLKVMSLSTISGLFTTRFVFLLAVAVHEPFVAVAVTVYLPAWAAVILFNTGFWSVEEKPLGPLHAYVTVPSLALGVTLKVTFAPSQTGLAGLKVISFSATAGSSTVTVTVLVAEQ